MVTRIEQSKEFPSMQKCDRLRLAKKNSDCRQECEMDDVVKNIWRRRLFLTKNKSNLNKFLFAFSAY